MGEKGRAEKGSVLQKIKKQKQRKTEGRAEAAEQWEYHNAIKGICCKAFLFLLSLWGTRLWEKRKERKDKEVLLDYFQSQNLVTEKPLAPQAVSSLAAWKAPTPRHPQTVLQAARAPARHWPWWILILSPFSPTPGLLCKLSTNQQISEKSLSKKRESEANSNLEVPPHWKMRPLHQSSSFESIT